MRGQSIARTTSSKIYDNAPHPRALATFSREGIDAVESVGRFWASIWSVPSQSHRRLLVEGGVDSQRHQNPPSRRPPARK
ncbi:hypothetical protein Hanom_Chr03g00182881 [Helianthus anomalus]